MIWVIALEVFFHNLSLRDGRAEHKLDPAYHLHYVGNAQSVRCVM
jgi:hypothetical protein